MGDGEKLPHGILIKQIDPDGAYLHANRLNAIGKIP